MFDMQIVPTLILILIVSVLVMVGIKLLKSLFKTFVLVVVLGAVLFAGNHFFPQYFSVTFVKESLFSAFTQQENLPDLHPALAAELADAKTTKKENGDFETKTKSFTITGNAKDKTVTIQHVNEEPVVVSMDTFNQLVSSFSANANSLQ